MERKRAEYKSSIASKKQLKTAFAELLYQTPKEKITVTKIIDKAGVSRSTFYAHYRDIDDLFSSIIREEAEKIVKIVKKPGLSNLYLEPRPVLCSIADLIAADANYYKTLYLSDKSGEFIRLFKEELTADLVSLIGSAKEDDREKAVLKVYLAFFVSAFLSVIVDVFNKELELPRDELIEIVATMIERSFGPQDK